MCSARLAPISTPTTRRLPSFWTELASLGWLGLHLSEAHGGSGYGLAELGIVVEELGRVVAPGPFLPTVLASAVIAERCGPAARDDLLPGLANGSRVAAVGLSGSLRLAGGVVAGDAGVVLGAPLADVLLLAAGEDCVVVDRNQRGVAVQPSPSLDRGRRVGRVRLTGCTVDSGRVLRGARTRALEIGRALAAAEAAGGAAACTESSSGYARERIAFGRPIGQFQAVKHHCANMLAQSEMAVAAAWDALHSAGDPHEAPLPTAVAAAVWPSPRTCTARGSTSRYTAASASRGSTTPTSFSAGPCRSSRCSGPSRMPVRPSSDRRWREGARRARLELPTAGDLRAAVRAFRDRYESLPEAARRDELVDSGYLVPHWPAPWGLGAGPAEQVVIDEELDGIPRRAGGGWIALTLASVGTPDQQARWIRPSLDGTLSIWSSSSANPTPARTWLP